MAAWFCDSCEAVGCTACSGLGYVEDPPTYQQVIWGRICDDISGIANGYREMERRIAEQEVRDGFTSRETYELIYGFHQEPTPCGESKL